MDPAELASLDDDCRTLGDALRQRQVPRDERRECRDLLHRAFLLRGDPESQFPEAALADLQAVASEVGALLARIGRKEGAPASVPPDACPGGPPALPAPEPAPFEPLAFRLARMWPVRIEGAIRLRFLDRHEATYARLGDRIQAITDWFWERCKPDEGPSRDKTPQEKAAEEIPAEALELVWGSRVRRPD